jgi:hypothetical protein
MPTLGSFADAAAAIVATGKRVEPEQRLVDQYDSQYAAFLGALRERGYLRENTTTESTAP